MKRVVEGETLEEWFAEILQPKLALAVKRGLIRSAQAETLGRRMADLSAVRRWGEGRRAA